MKVQKEIATTTYDVPSKSILCVCVYQSTQLC